MFVVGGAWGLLPRVDIAMFVIFLDSTVLLL